MEDWNDPQGRRLPIKVDTTSNGEYVPRPLSRAEALGNQLAFDAADSAARRLGVKRRAFLKSSCGAAATLLAFNQANAAFGGGGGRFALAPEAAFEPAAADAVLKKDGQFIFDMQLHCMDPSGSWAQGADGETWAWLLNQVSPQRRKCGGTEADFSCFSAEFLIREVFMDSDTHSGVISAVWGLRGQNPSPTEYAAEARSLVAALDSPSRLLIQGGVLPNEPGALEFMEVQARDYHVNAWKLYPQWGPDGVGFLMDDPELGLPFLERVRELKVPIVAAHRGLSLSFFRDELESALPLQDKYADPTDIARVAAMYPDITFICYHSGFEPTVVEGPYDPENPQGMDRFIKAALENGLQPNRGNLYAELGSLWRDKMGKPDEAAHVMGKLLKYFGEDRILWGTDCIWYGSPQDQIMALRAFEISKEFQERYGYPALTPLRKAKIFGLNGAELHNLDVSSMIQARQDDPVGRLRAEYQQEPEPSFLTYGPRTRREFLSLRNQTRGRPD